MSQFGRSADSLWIITSYFNWCRYKSKYDNYKVFCDGIRKMGVNLLTIECALMDHKFQLPAGRNVVHVRTASIMWQKERLLNIAIDALPATCQFVVWVDCDLIFTSSTWVSETISGLEQYAVLQPFDKMIRLPKGRTVSQIGDAVSTSFMGGIRASAEGVAPPRVGHPGFAWAARRDVLEACNGLYDACIVGGADRVIAHAFFGDYHGKVVSKIVLGGLGDHYLDWAKRAHRIVRRSVTLVNGLVLHLWHGSSADRLYFERHEFVDGYGFNPRHDLAVNKWGCWEWASDKPELHNWIQSYFSSRNEDA